MADIVGIWKPVPEEEGGRTRKKESRLSNMSNQREFRMMQQSCILCNEKNQPSFG